MAMIQCPKCGKDISDKSEKCVHCGAKFVPDERICEECGEVLKKTDKVCSKCGCPVSSKNDKPQQVEVTGVSIKPKMTKKKIIILVSILVGLIAIGIGAKIIVDKKAQANSEEYKSNLETIVLDMLSGAAKAEKCGNLIKKVWNNSIFKQSDPETDKYTHDYWSYNDFNTALKKLFDDTSFSAQIKSIEDNQSRVASQMKNMKNPPEEWKDAYDDLKDYYEEYLNFTNLVISPSGSLTSFSSSFNDADSKTLNMYNKMKTYLDF